MTNAVIDVNTNGIGRINRMLDQLASREDRVAVIKSLGELL